MKQTYHSSYKLDILNAALDKGSVSIEEFFWMPSFRTRISELNRDYMGIFEKKQKTKTNKYGRKYTYTVHIVKEDVARNAIKDIKDRDAKCGSK